MDSAEKPTYLFENVEINVARGCVLREGEERHLRPKTFQVLLHLVENRERLVTKTELIETVWKDTAVTDDVLVQCVKEIRRVLGDDSHKPQFVKTVPKIGYRFIRPVEIAVNHRRALQTEEITRIELEYEEESDDHLQTSPSRARLNGKNRFSVLKLAAAAAAATVLITSAVYVVPKFIFAESRTAQSSIPQITGKKSVAVMYFKNQTENAELDWLREGLADMLIGDLSRSDKLAVVSRGQLSAFLESQSISTNSDRATAELETARRLKVDVVVTGGFARVGERVRLDVQILETASGSIIAAENLIVDKPEQLLADIDLLSLKIARHLDAIPEHDGSVAETMTNDLAAYRFYSLGVEKARALQLDEAIVLLKQAVERDPRFAMAHARIGYAYAVMNNDVERGKPYLEKAYQLSDRLTEKDRLNITAWYATANLDFEMAISNYRQIIDRYPLETESYGQLAKLLSGEGKREDAILVVRQGISIDPMEKNLHNTLGSMLSSLGRHDEAIAAHQRYVELAPSEPNAYDSLGLSYQWAGDYAHAIENYDRAIRLNPEFRLAIIHFANTRFRLGQYRSAIDLFKKYVELANSDFERERGFYNLALVHLCRGDLQAAKNAALKARPYVTDTFWADSIIRLRPKPMTHCTDFPSGVFKVNSPVDRGRRFNQRFEFFYRGAVALDEGRNEEALDAFREALDHPPPAWNLYDFEDCLASTLLRLGRYDEAIAEYERILQLSPNYPLATYSLAQAYEAKGQNDLALAAYQRFLAEWSEADKDILELEKARRYVTIASTGP